MPPCRLVPLRTRKRFINRFQGLKNPSVSSKRRKGLLPRYHSCLFHMEYTLPDTRMPYWRNELRISLAVNKKNFAKRDEGWFTTLLLQIQALPISCPYNDGLSSCPTKPSEGNSRASSIHLPRCFAPANSSLKGSPYLLLPITVFLYFYI